MALLPIKFTSKTSKNDHFFWIFGVFGFSGFSWFSGGWGWRGKLKNDPFFWGVFGTPRTRNLGGFRGGSILKKWKKWTFLSRKCDFPKPITEKVPPEPPENALFALFGVFGVFAIFGYFRQFLAFFGGLAGGWIWDFSGFPGITPVSRRWECEWFQLSFQVHKYGRCLILIDDGAPARQNRQVAEKTETIIKRLN